MNVVVFVARDASVNAHQYVLQVLVNQLASEVNKYMKSLNVNAGDSTREMLSRERSVSYVAATEVRLLTKATAL